jgi:hypothetical protein
MNATIGSEIMLVFLRITGLVLIYKEKKLYLNRARTDKIEFQDTLFQKTIQCVLQSHFHHPLEVQVAVDNQLLKKFFFKLFYTFNLSLGF